MKKRILSIILSLCFVVSLASGAFAYSDTTEHWASAAIDKWSGYGVVNGVGNNEFDPCGDLTRAQAAQVFVNLLKLPEASEAASFADLPEGKWYTSAVSTCVEQGILQGNGNGNVLPLDTITRQEFFVMFARALNIPEETEINGDFADASSVSSWAVGAVSALVNNGYVRGLSSTTIGPKAEINRASVVSLLSQTIAGYANTDGDSITVDEDGIVLVVADDVTVSGSGNVTVAVAKSGAKVNLSGLTGKVAVVIQADDVAITGAPAGTTVTVADGVTGATVNGTSVAVGSDYSVPTASSSSSSSSSSSGTISGGTTGDDNTGDSSTGDSTTGDSSTGDSTTGNGTTGNGTTGNGTTGNGTTGNGTTGNGTTGNGTTGNGTTGNGTTGNGTTGNGTTGNGTTGGDETDDEETTVQGIEINEDGVAISVDEDAIIEANKDGATINLKGKTGDTEVKVAANNVTVNNAPNGTVVTIAEGVTGTKVNDEDVSATYTVGDTEIVALLLGNDDAGDSTTGNGTTGNGTTGNGTTGNGTTGNGTTGNGTTGNGTTGNGTTGNGTTGNGTTGNGTTGNGTTGNGTTGNGTTGNGTTGNGTTGGSTTGSAPTADILRVVIGETISISGNVSVEIVVNAPVTIDLGGLVGDVEITIAVNDVVVENAAAGISIVVTGNATSANINGETVEAGKEYEVPDTTGDDTTGGSSTGGSSTGDSTTGNGTTGNGTTGNGTTGDSTTGNGTTGNGTTGNGTTGDSTTGNGTTGNGTTGNGTTGNGTTGNGTTGNGTTGNGTTGNGTTGNGTTGNGTTGNGTTGNGTTGGSSTGGNTTGQTPTDSTENTNDATTEE